jgi:hypothetical protein
MRKLDVDSDGNFNLGGSSVDVVPVGEPIVVWCGVGQKSEAGKRTELFGRYSQRACRGVNTDFFVLGRSLFVGNNIEQFGVQFYRHGKTTEFSSGEFGDGVLHHLKVDASGGFLLNNKSLNARPVGTPVVSYHSINSRRNPALYPIELSDFARELGFGLNNGPNAFTFGNSLDPDGINYIATQFYRI